MRRLTLMLALGCAAFAPLPPVELSVRIAAVPPVVREGLIGRIDLTPDNNGDAVRKHKLTGHVTVIRITARREGPGTGELRLAPGRAPGWVCSAVRGGLSCGTDATVERGPGPRIPVTLRASAAGDFRVCAEISAEGRTERTPGDNRSCATTRFVPVVDTQVDS